MHELGNGYKAIAPPGEMLPMDSGCETTLVSALLDGRRVVALQVLCVSVERLGNRRQLADFCGLAAGQEDSLLDVSRL